MNTDDSKTKKYLSLWMAACLLALAALLFLGIALKVQKVTVDGAAKHILVIHIPGTAHTATLMLPLTEWVKPVDGSGSASPIFTSTPIPTPTPEATPSPKPTPTLVPTTRPEPTPVPELTPTPFEQQPVGSTAETDPDDPQHKYSTEIMADGSIVENYERDKAIFFKDSNTYTQLEGILTFRGNHYRNAPSFGTVGPTASKLTASWTQTVGGIDEWTGVGWNGQPVIVRWPDELREQMNLYENKRTKEGLVEVIYAALDGKVYFWDAETGEATRDPIVIGFPVKGSVAVDPRGYPLLYVGQGINTVGETTGQFNYRIISLIDSTVLYRFTGNDKFAYRSWGAFDSNPLLDPETDTLIECGENGILYTVKLNTVYDASAGTVSISPAVTKFRYKSAYSSTVGTEGSPVIYGSNIIYIDNSGFMQCVNLNNFKSVWVRSCTDDTDSTLLLDLEGDQPYVYTACEVDHQGENGSCYIRKINALNGELVWERSYRCYYHTTNGGALASPAIGKNDLAGLVFYTVAKTKDTKGNGILVALNKETGEVVWSFDMPYYAWSSPVDVYTDSGKGYIVQCDSAGICYLIDGLTGGIVNKLSLGSNVEASPAVFENQIIVGTRGQKVYGITIS